MSNVQQFNQAGFQTDVMESSEPVLVDFYADWCGPCKMMAPVVEEVARDYSGRLKVGKLDTDANQDIAMQFGIMGIPTLGLFANGKLVDRLTGFPGGKAGVVAWLDKALTPVT